MTINPEYDQKAFRLLIATGCEQVSRILRKCSTNRLKQACKHYFKVNKKGTYLTVLFSLSVQRRLRYFQKDRNSFIATM
jgi:hypothetical protein